MRSYEKNMQPAGKTNTGVMMPCRNGLWRQLHSLLSSAPCVCDNIFGHTHTHAHFRTRITEPDNSCNASPNRVLQQCMLQQTHAHPENSSSCPHRDSWQTHAHTGAYNKHVSTRGLCSKRKGLIASACPHGAYINRMPTQGPTVNACPHKDL